MGKRNKFKEKLTQKGALKYRGKIWISGGMKVLLLLAGGYVEEKELKLYRRNSENIQMIKNLLAIEKREGYKVIYDDDLDELYMCQPKYFAQLKSEAKKHKMPLLKWAKRQEII